MTSLTCDLAVKSDRVSLVGALVPQILHDLRTRLSLHVTREDASKVDLFCLAVTRRRRRRSWAPCSTKTWPAAIKTKLADRPCSTKT